MIGTLLTNWTIRLALVCYVAYLAGWLSVTHPRWPTAARWIWTLGCGLFVAHVACAFHFYHDWSHAAAWRDTAEQTQRIIGVAFGNGIYFNYTFLTLWVADVVWLSLPRASQSPGMPSALPRQTFGSPTARVGLGATGVPRRSPSPSQTPAWRILVHVFLIFIAFNGAIVFESGPTRWAGIVACCGLSALAGWRAYNWPFSLRNSTLGEVTVASKPPGAATE
jgi:hypothetical protein